MQNILNRLKGNKQKRNVAEPQQNEEPHISAAQYSYKRFNDSRNKKLMSDNELADNLNKLSYSTKNNNSGPLKLEIYHPTYANFTDRGEPCGSVLSKEDEEHIYNEILNDPNKVYIAPQNNMSDPNGTLHWNGVMFYANPKSSRIETEYIETLNGSKGIYCGRLLVNNTKKRFDQLNRNAASYQQKPSREPLNHNQRDSNVVNNSNLMFTGSNNPDTTPKWDHLLINLAIATEEAKATAQNGPSREQQVIYNKLVNMYLNDTEMKGKREKTIERLDLLNKAKNAAGKSDPIINSLLEFCKQNNTSQSEINIQQYNPG